MSIKENLLVALTMELCTFPGCSVAEILQALVNDPHWGGNVSLPNYLLPIVGHMVDSYEREDDHPGVYEYEVVPALASYLALQILQKKRFPPMGDLLAKLWLIESEFFPTRKVNRIPEYSDRAHLLNWCTNMAAKGLMFHPEDDPADVMNFEEQLPVFNPTEVDTLRRQIPLMVEHWGIESLCEVFNAFSRLSKS